MPFKKEVLSLPYSKIIAGLALVYAFVLPLSRAGISFFTLLLIFVWLLEGNFKHKMQKILDNKVMQVLFVFLLFNMISSIWTDNILGTVDYVKKYWYFSPIVIFYTSLKKEYIHQILSAFILGMFVSEIIAYGVFFELWQYKHATPDNPSPFMHHIEYSVFLAFSALILLGRIFHEAKLYMKLSYAFFFLSISGNLFLTAGRTGQIAFVLGLFVLAMVSFKNKVKALSVFVLLSAVILTVAFQLSDTFKERVLTAQHSMRSVVNEQNYCSSWGSRVGVCMIAKEMIENHPLIGEGIMDNMRRLHTLIDKKYPEMKCVQANLMHMHNQYIQIVTEIGLIGLVLFLGIFYQIGRLDIQNKAFLHMKYIYLTVLLFSFVSEVIFHRQFSMAFFALIVGLLLVENRVNDEV